MKILSIVSVLPTKTKPWVQPFVKTQIDSLRDLGISVEVFNLTESFGEGWQKYLKGIFSLRKILQNSGFDLIHAHYSYCGIVGMFQSRLPLVVSLMGSDLGSDKVESEHISFRKRIESISGKFVARFSDHVIVKSREMAELIPFCKNIHVIPNGVDFYQFKPMDNESAKSKFDLPRNKAIILFASDPESPRKNIALAKEAYNILNRLNPEKFYFWNAWQISHTMMPFVFNAADVLVFTSLFEGSPNLIKEAMACNLPIVSVSVGDVPDLLRGAMNCYLVDYSPTKIAERIQKVISSGSRSNGREKIEHLKIESVAKLIEAVYREVLVSHQNALN